MTSLLVQPRYKPKKPLVIHSMWYDYIKWDEV